MSDPEEGDRRATSRASRISGSLATMIAYVLPLAFVSSARGSAIPLGLLLVGVVIAWLAGALSDRLAPGGHATGWRAGLPMGAAFAAGIAAGMFSS